jgi:Na+/melibiose symporter-like transporter
MRKRLKAYLQYSDKKTREELTPQEKARVKEELLIQIRFFQHERLIHALVTLTFAILSVITLFFLIFYSSKAIESEHIFVYTFFFLLMALLIPYIRHYFFLERGVQKLYEYYDRLI